MSITASMPMATRGRRLAPGSSRGFVGFPELLLRCCRRTPAPNACSAWLAKASFLPCATARAATAFGLLGFQRGGLHFPNRLLGSQGTAPVLLLHLVL